MGNAYCFCLRSKALCLLGCAYRAVALASSAIDAGVLVDDVDAVSLGNSSDGAVCCAGTAGDASITDLICHN